MSTLPFSQNVMSEAENIDFPGKLVARKPGGFFERIFAMALRKHQNGFLLVIRPDGTYFQAGASNDDPPAVIRVLDRHFFVQAVLFGEIGLGEAYMYGYFESPDLHKVLEWFLRNSEITPSLGASVAQHLLIRLFSMYNQLLHMFRSNTERRARKNIALHYDIGNALYQTMLDPGMTYSSAIYRSPESGESLEEAQYQKFERICQKLHLKPGMHLLEIGSGWGGFAIYAARHYGVQITTVTISKEQYLLAKERIESEGFSGQIQILLQDFRRITGKFDRIVSIEMAEALGRRYVDTYFSKIENLLAEDGLVVLQYINYPESRYDRYATSTDFIQKHIFPGGLLLSHREVLNSLHRCSQLCLYDLESFGMGYARSLHQWRLNFTASLDRIRHLGYSDIFIRKWNYYLLSCEVAFRERYINVCQVLLSRPQNPHMLDSTF